MPRMVLNEWYSLFLTETCTGAAHGSDNSRCQSPAIGSRLINDENLAGSCKLRDGMSI